MLLQSKKVGIMLKIKQLSNTRILNEINRIMFEGAEVLIILLGEKKEQETNSFSALFHKLSTFQTMTEVNKEQDIEMPLDKFRPDMEGFLFDLLVFIPCTGKQLSLLAEIIPGL